MRTPSIGVITVVAVFLCGCQFVMAQSIQSVNILPPMRRHAALIEKAQKQGEVPVIVQLKSSMGFQTAKTGTKRAAFNTEEIQAVQDRMLSSLEGISNARTLRQIPFLAFHANERALAQLFESDNVGVIQEDEHFEPLLEESTASIGAEVAWTYGGSGAGEVIAIIDTGFDGTHPFLEDKLVAEACFSSNYVSTSSDFESISLCPGPEDWAEGAGAAINCDPSIDGCSHGTRVAGIVAGHSEDFSGVARDAGILGIQVFSRFENYCGDEPCVRSWVSDQVAALDYIYQVKDSLNISAVNLSLGSGHYTDEETCNEVNQAMRFLIDALHEEGIAVIAAAGNSGLVDGLVSPACISNAISVGATTKDDGIATFSSSASFLDFLAPGQDIVTSVPGGGYAISAGTSFSAPHVAGAWAILHAANPDATVEDIRTSLQETGFAILDERNDVITSRIQVDVALLASQLPVELVSFDAKVQDDELALTWKTATEVNNAGFEIEEKTAGGFNSLAFVPGQGTVAEETTYYHTIDRLAPGWHTFRLKQIDFDGRFSFSDEKKVFLEIAGAFHFGAAYPNPFNPRTQFTLTLATKQHVVIEVYNLIGKRVLTLANEELEENQPYLFTLDAGALPNGIYLIQATGQYFKATKSVTLLK